MVETSNFQQKELNLSQPLSNLMNGATKVSGGHRSLVFV